MLINLEPLVRLIYLSIFLLSGFQTQFYESEIFYEEKIFDDVRVFQIANNSCETIHYKNRIGYNYASALDSLLKTLMLPNSGCPNHPCHEYVILKDTIAVNFDVDDRNFFTIVFQDVSSNMKLMSVSDVIDDNGNHYKIYKCED